jgi:fluoride exporter
MNPLLDRLGPGPDRIAAVMLGGAAGTLARAAMDEAVPHRPGAWPWSTFTVNLVGALILGWLLAHLAERAAASPHLRLLVGTGFCGALTTFSTFQMETVELAREGRPGLAVAYPLASVAAGMALAVAGVTAARRGRRWRER